MLEPMLGPDIKLAPYEIFYLTDVLNEDVGYRNQGLQLSAQLQYSDGWESNSNASQDRNSRHRAPQAVMAWYHNLSLNHQVMCTASWSYRISNYNNNESQYGELRGSLGHLWNIADRHLWENTINAGGNSRIESEIRTRTVDYQSVLTTYIEDRLSLQTRINARYSWRKSDPGVNHGWSWGYSLGLVYHLDRVLF